MKKIICWLILFSFISGCSTTKKKVTEIDPESVSYACLEPNLVLSGETINGYFFEQITGVEVNKDVECTKHYSILGKTWELHGAGGVSIYLIVSALTMGIVPAADLLGSILEPVIGKPTGTFCDEKVKEKQTIEKQKPATGKFSGKITVVKLDQPDWYRERVYSYENLGSVEVPVDNAYTDYAVELTGDYKSDNVNCRVDTQTIVKR